MRTTRHSHDPVLITDAEMSVDDELRERKKIYAVLMAVHVIGFTVAGVLAAVTQLWLIALALAVVTGVLPWVAVILANERRVASKGERAEKPTSQDIQRR